MARCYGPGSDAPPSRLSDCCSGPGVGECIARRLARNCSRDGLGGHMAQIAGKAREAASGWREGALPILRHSLAYDV